MPHQSGLAEKKNRHLAETCRSMLHAKNVLSCFRAEFMKTVIYATNRLPQAKLGVISHHKLWNVKPTLIHFSIFGCVRYVFIPNHLRSKFDTKVIHYIFMGHDNEGKEWRRYEPTTECCYTSRNVVFDEASSWWSSQAMALSDLKEIKAMLKQRLEEHFKTDKKESSHEEVP